MTDVQTPGRPTVPVLAALAVVLGIAGVLLAWGVVGDLPYAPDVDEPIYMQAAIHAIRHASLDPGWFGNPGSTVIYPSAALIEAWYLVARHVPPFAHAMPGIDAELSANPMPFYVIARLVSAAYGVAAIGATWLLARRLVGDVGGILAAVLVVATGIIAAYAHLFRADTAGLCFGILALWLMLRALANGRWRDWILAAVTIGLAVSTRYFYATLVVPYAVAAVLWLRGPRPSLAPPRRWHVPLVAAIAVPIAFAATSPFALLDIRRTIQDLRFEARTDHPGADGLSFLGNLAFYLGDAIPANFSLVLLALAAIGAVILARRQPRAIAVLGAFAISYLVGTSASPLHWDRYVMPLAPLFAIGAVATLLAIADGAVGWVARRRARGTGSPGTHGAVGAIDVGESATAATHHRPAAIVVAAVMVGLLAVPSLLDIAAADQLRATPTTRAVASDWIRANLPAGSRIAGEMYTAYADATDDLLRVATLSDRPLEAFQADGYRYLLWSSAMAERFDDAARYPVEHARYAALDRAGRRLATFEAGPDRTGPEIRVYEIGGP
jgi:hypothetical protein